jgi:hypothetical protein
MTGPRPRFAWLGGKGPRIMRGKGLDGVLVRVALERWA